MRENEFQMRVVKEIKKLLPGAIVLKNDSGYMQGIPDLSIFHNDKWGMLECKVDWIYQPNQEYYLALLDSMSFAKVIHPSNKEMVLHELVQALS